MLSNVSDSFVHIAGIEIGNNSILAIWLSLVTLVQISSEVLGMANLK